MGIDWRVICQDNYITWIKTEKKNTLQEKVYRQTDFMFIKSFFQLSLYTFYHGTEPYVDSYIQFMGVCCS